MVEFRVGGPQEPEPQLDFAQTVGRAVEITPRRPLPDATIHLRFDPHNDLPRPSAGEPAATATNAFIGIYNTDAGAWIPLETTYIADAQELVATAPHFSWIQRFIVNPGKHIAHAAVVGAKAVGATASFVTDQATTGIMAFRDSAVALIREKWSGQLQEGQKAECPPDSRSGYRATVKGDDTGLVACVAEEKGGDGSRRWLRLENHLAAALYMDASTPLGLGPNAYDLRNRDDAVYGYARLWHWAIGQGLVAGPGSAELEIPPDAPQSFSVALHMDQYPSVIGDVLLGLLNVIPAIATVEVPLAQAEGRVFLRVATATAETTFKATFSETLVRQVDEELAGPLLKRAHTLLDGLSCLGAVSKLDKWSIDEALAIVDRCLQSVIENLAPNGGELLHAFSGIVGTLKLRPELRDLLAHGLATPVVTVNSPSTVSDPRTGLGLTLPGSWIQLPLEVDRFDSATAALAPQSPDVKAGLMRLRTAVYRTSVSGNAISIAAIEPTTGATVNLISVPASGNDPDHIALGAQRLLSDGGATGFSSSSIQLGGLPATRQSFKQTMSSESVTGEFFQTQIYTVHAGRDIILTLGGTSPDLDLIAASVRVS